MLPDDKDAVPEREPLVGEVRNGGVEGRMPYGNARRGSDKPTDMLLGPVPHVDPERQLGGGISRKFGLASSHSRASTRK
jgi:hypothetical protein